MPTQLPDWKEELAGRGEAKNGCAEGGGESHPNHSHPKQGPILFSHREGPQSDGENKNSTCKKSLKATRKGPGAEAGFKLNLLPSDPWGRLEQ